MSDTDSFINEVTEEVRREKLFGYLRRYGWIAVAAVLLLVGGAGFNEYRKAQQTALAQDTGDALFAALEQPDASERANAMAQIAATGASVAVAGLLQAATEQEAGDIDAAAATLSALAANPDVPETYRDIAALKAAMLPTDDADAQRAALQALSQPGQPFRLLALEQLAYLDLAAGQTEEALTKLRQIEEDASVSRGTLERVQSTLVALGEEPAAPAAQ